MTATATAARQHPVRNLKIVIMRILKRYVARELYRHPLRPANIGMAGLAR